MPMTCTVIAEVFRNFVEVTVQDVRAYDPATSGANKQLLVPEKALHHALAQLRGTCGHLHTLRTSILEHVVEIDESEYPDFYAAHRAGFYAFYSPLSLSATRAVGLAFGIVLITR